MPKQITQESGFSLIELMIVIALIGIVLSIAAPSLSGLIQQKRLGGAAENLASDLQYARSEAIKRNASTYLIFQRNSGDWCYGISTNSACDCSTSPATSCDLKTIRSTDYPNVSLAASVTDGTVVAFDRVRGVPSASLNIDFGDSPALRTTITAIGRSKICSPDSDHLVPGYKPC
ncbi:GspH/FimT family pseudopilin [Jeongeupia naejangsanensis]|uniref:Type II secretion system protein H n=1 Tax=Jeongeupia naejangsanensis TaxID=613195 RepID=A0ABS2BGD3_9NEIS|nr:GspH/FimT family pseudopilin [Jeongeupia naejangsanensis]MBM3114682.1 GspH/FimT family pseudopilin [Jeongeupia naejangsanensis]